MTLTIFVFEIILFLGFRYKDCHLSNLNGYNWGPGNTDFAVGVCWSTYSTYNNSMKLVEMAVRGNLRFNVYSTLLDQQQML